MNHIQHVWDEMGAWIRDMDEPSSTVLELQRVVFQVWAAVHPRKGEDPGGEHATRCACSSRRQMGSHKKLMVW